MHPLTPLELPADDWSGFLADRAQSQLALAQDAVARLKQQTVAGLEALQTWNEADTALRNASGFTSLLAEVHPDAPLREQAEAIVQEVSRYSTELSLDADLYAVLAAIDPAGFDDAATRMLERTLLGFRRSGVDRDEATRQRLKAIAERQTVLGQEFSRNIRDDVRHVRLRPEQLGGLPQDFIDAHPAGDDGLVELSTDYPDVIPFRTFAHDGAARRELVEAFLNRAWPQNDRLLQEIVQLRAEWAALLGYRDWADYDVEVKMIGRGEAIGEFIDRIAGLADDPGRRDIALLLERAQRDDPSLTSLTSADSMYFAELLRRERFGVDAQQVRQYFDFAAVRQGLLEVTGRIFGLEYVPLPDAPRWHSDVTAYDVLRGGERIGRIYLDLHPREGKFKHAAQFDITSGVAGVQLPEGALVCNFPRGLMEHSDVVTLFHEFGHLVHHVLAGHQEWAMFSGVATEWDFVEAPSQMLEEWAWNAQVLGLFARNTAGEVIPPELVAQMREASDFGRGYFARTQMFYAALSYYLHLRQPTDTTALVQELQEKYDLFGYLPGTHFQASFGHLVGYGSGYYTYMWSLVIAKDMFTAFGADLLDPAVAGRYAKAVLAPGGSADAADLVADFLGRPYSFEAYGAWLAG